MSLQDLNKTSLSTLPYPEEYLIEEGDLPDTTPQSNLAVNMTLTLRQFYRQEQWLVAINLAVFHPTIRNSQRYVVPDLAVFKDIQIPPDEQLNMSSYQVNPPARPMPPIVFEIASKETWQTDIGGEEHHKPALYGRLGVREYFTYDPNERMLWRGTFRGLRLVGWRYQNSEPIGIQADSDTGWLYSEVLESYLSADGLQLQIRDMDGNIRPTGLNGEAIAQVHAEMVEARARLAEAESFARQAETNFRLEAEARAREKERAIKAEAQAVQAENRASAEAKARSEEQARAVEAEARAKQAETIAKTEAEARAKAENLANAEAEARAKAENLANAEAEARARLERENEELRQLLEKLRQQNS
jgi:Uma2 family endonuclease